MPLYRAIYIREGKPLGMTFAKRNAALAAEFAYTILQRYIRSAGGGDILTVSEVPSKRPNQSLS